MNRAPLAALALAALIAAAPAVADDPPVEQTKKNIKVLNGLPSSQLIPVMAFMSNSLGVTCAHCHTAAWDSDEKPAKDVARRMLAMTRDINQRHFPNTGNAAAATNGPAVTCNTCHQGHVRPASIPLLANAGWNQQPATAAKTAAPLPSAEELVKRYVAAVGGAELIAKATARDARGTATRFNGRTEPVSGPFAIKQQLPSNVSIDTELSYPPEANREVGGQFFKVTRLAQQYASMKTAGIAQVRGRDAYVVEATPKEGRAERLYFDVGTGLLLRRARELATPLGILPEEYDFDDWRTGGGDVAGIKAPFTMVWSRADYRVTHKFDEVNFRSVAAAK